MVGELTETAHGTTVALLAEGVGRNDIIMSAYLGADPSPSSRRAWVEISRSLSIDAYSVSPSSRRAWVEILLPR